MIQSLKLSDLFLRFGLAFVFLWFGIDKLIHPNYWINAWSPQAIAPFLSRIGIATNDVMNASAIFEILVGASLLSGIFIKTFSLIAVIFLISVSIMFGFSEILVRDIGLMGALVAIIFWPTRRSY